MWRPQRPLISPPCPPDLMASPLRKIVTLLGSRMATRAAQVLAFLVLARVLSPAGFGAYGAATAAIFLTGQIGNLGLRQAAAYRIGRGTMTDGQATGVLLVYWPLAVLASVPLVLIFNAEAIGMMAQTANHADWAIGIAVAGVLFTVLLQGVFLGRGEIKAFALADAGPRLLQSGLAMLLWLVGALTLSSALWSFAAGFALIAPVTLWLALRTGSPLSAPVGQLPAMVRHGFLFALSMFLVTLQTRLGVFVLQGLQDPEAAGQFFAAQRATELFLEVATAVGLVMFSEAARTDSFQESLSKGLTTAVGLFALFVVGGAVMALAAPLVVLVLLGPQYAGATDALRILAIGLPAAAFVKIMNGVLAGSGKPFVSASVVGLGVAVNLGLSVVLAPSLGATGVAWAMSAALVVTALAYLIVSTWLYGARIEFPRLHIKHKGRSQP